jgi:hypothetical protein
MRLSELQGERGSKEAEMRYNLWQSNNEILDRKLQNELSIRQANTALRQQRFQNRMGLGQQLMAAQVVGSEGLNSLAQTQQEEAEAIGKSNDKAVDRQYRAALEEAKEAGRNYRAGLLAQGRGAKPKPYASANSDTKDDAWNDLVDALDGRDMSPRQALQVATAIMGGYGWSMKNAAVQSLAASALREAGFEF